MEAEEQKVVVAMKKPRVLLVDDNIAVLEVFKEGLQSCGFEVIAAPTVNAALGLIVSDKFDDLFVERFLP